MNKTTKIVKKLGNIIPKDANSYFKGKYDLVVVGGGIVGVASARELSMRLRHLKMAVLEKEPKLAAHQSGHNSGVIHAGIYYKPGTLKAMLCVEGLRRMYVYAEEKKIPFKKIGKLIVATKQSELDGLQTLYERGLQNDVPGLRLVDGMDIPSIEPNCIGLKAILSPQTGIIDYARVTQEYGNDFTNNNGTVLLNFEVSGFRESTEPDYPVEIYSKDNKQTVQAKYVLTCGGLYSDHLAVMSGCSEVPKIVPFRGEYLILKNTKNDLVKGNIYPVPDPRFPFLGVHFTPRLDGSIWLGPNALLAFKREGYKWSDLDVNEFRDALQYKGFRKLAMKYVRHGMKEMMYSCFMGLQVKELQRFVPSLKAGDVERGPTGIATGVRAQALNADGELIDDFYFDSSNEKGIGKRILHCRNAPSPGATSSLAIANMMADKMITCFFDKFS